LCGSTVTPGSDSFKHLYYVARRFFGESPRQRSSASGRPSYVRSIELLFDPEEIFMDAMVIRLGRPLLGGTPGPIGRAARPAPVRLTRRGRFVVLAFLIAVAALAVVLVARPGNADDPTRPQPVAVVHAGDTLWSIAASYAPHRDRRDTIEDIRRLNHLDGYTLEVGQRLRLPR
jgi:hypothetical protein